MCVFCEIVSGSKKELPWAGNEPILEESKSVLPLNDPNPEANIPGKGISPGGMDK